MRVFTHREAIGFCRSATAQNINHPAVKSKLMPIPSMWFCFVPARANIHYLPDTFLQIKSVNVAGVLITSSTTDRIEIGTMAYQSLSTEINNDKYISQRDRNNNKLLIHWSYRHRNLYNYP